MEKDIPANNYPNSPEDWLGLLRESPCGYILTNPKGRILKVNNTLARWLKYERKEIENELKFQDLLPVGDRIFYETKHTVLLKLQEQVSEVNYQLKCKNGSRMQVLLNSAQHRDKKTGDIVAFQFIVLPFSDRKKYELELLNAKKKSEEIAAAKSMFFSTITHEIRTPIHAILNAGNILLKENPSLEQQELLEIISLSSHTLLELVNSVLDLTKMESGNTALNIETFNIQKLAQELLKICNPLALGKDIEFNLVISNDIPSYVIGDRIKIRQVLTNLIGNSIKFTDKGRIDFLLSLKETNAEGCVVSFELKDTGIGMSEQSLQKIFEPFTQANNSIHQKYGGSGLGLTIAQKLLKLLGSDLSVSSQLGVGTTFHFNLQMQQGEAKESKVTESPLSLEPFDERVAQTRILIVDDIFSNVLIIKRFFKTWNIPFDYAPNGKEAIKKVKEEEFDIVFLDISMPDMDGYEVTEKIRALPGDRFQKLNIVALTAFDSKEVEVKIQKAGMNGILQKPFDAYQLYQFISTFGNLTDKQALDKQADQPNSLDLEHVSLNYICNFFDYDDTEIRGYFAAVRRDLTKLIKDFSTAKDKVSPDIYHLAVHSSATFLDFFELGQLKSKMKEGTQLLADGKQTAFLDKSEEIITFLQQFSIWIQQKIDQKEDVCKPLKAT